MIASGSAGAAPSAPGAPLECESCPQLRRFRTLIQAGETLCSTLDVKQVLDQILAFVTRELQAERSTLYVVEPHSNDLVSLIAQGLDDGVRIRLKIGEGLAGHVAATGEVVTVSNAYDDARFAVRFDRDTGFRTSSMMAIPLTRKDAVMGVLQVLNRRLGFFDQADRQYLLALGNLIAVAIENARLHEQEVMRQRLEAEKEQMERELRLARSIQERFLPRGAPDLGAVDVAGVNIPSEHVSGDYYDFFTEGAFGANGGGGATMARPARLGIAVADVSGHGIPAAILMSVIHAGLRTPETVAMRAAATGAGADAAGSTSPGERLTFLNQLLFSSTDDSHFATMFLGIVDLETRRLRYASGGHPLPILVRAEGTVERLVQGGVTLGMLPEFGYGEREIALAPGDMLVVYTDGVTEAMRDGEEFDDPRLIETLSLARARGAGAAEIASAIMDAVREWAGRAQLDDDVTAVVLRVR